MAVVAAMEMLDLRDDATALELAPLFLYYHSRTSPDFLGDVSLRTALATAAQRGVCRAPLHPAPVTPGGAKVRPTPEAEEDARLQRLAGYDPNRRRTRYHLVVADDRVAAMRAVLAAGLPLVVGVWTTSEYWAELGMRTVPAEPAQGAHAVTVFGSESADGDFLVLDSRGPGFAQDGCWRMSADVARSRLIDEVWTLENLNYA